VFADLLSGALQRLASAAAAPAAAGTVFRFDQ